MNSKTIFKYIQEHIDEDGRFTEIVLPDDPNPAVPRRMGGEDAYYYTTEVPPDTESAERTIELLKQYQAVPCLESRRRLYDHLCSIIVSGICDPFLDNFMAEDFTDDTVQLARSLFYNAAHREPVKFAYLLFGLYGMEKIKNTDGELWHDLLTVARCEEYTFFFLYACRITEFSPQEEIWQLINCTEAWGRVYAINEAQFDDAEKRRWLLMNGYDIDVEYPPLSVKIITESKMADFLQQENISFDEYKGAITALNNFLLLLNNFPLEVIEMSFNTASIDLPLLLENVLRHGKKYAVKIEDILDILAMSVGLRHLADNENWNKIAANDCHVLLAACDKIIYQKDWQKEINEKLIVDGEVNYILCDFAFEMEVDIWRQLFEYYCAKPEETALFPYLLAFGDDERSDRALAEIERNLYAYMTDPNALLVPLRYLKNYPGKGAGIIIAALTSLYDWPRGVACMVLEVWGQEQLTAALRHALLRARTLSNHEAVKMRIDRLLAGSDSQDE